LAAVSGRTPVEGLPILDVISFEPVTATDADHGLFRGKSRRRQGGFILEHAFMGGLLLCVGWVVWRFVRDGYLPQPFYYLVHDSLMDLYTTAAWAHRDGAYSTWRTLYPPLSFDLLRLFTNGKCYIQGETAGRRCDHAALGVLIAVFLANAGLVAWSYRLIDPRTAIPRAAAVAMGLPMLYALERGNLLIPCFTAFVLGTGPLVRSRWGRIVALAMSVNFKPYLLGVFLPAVARRDWRWLLSFGAVGLAIYIATFLVEGAGTPQQLLFNIDIYRAGNLDLWSNIYYATSYWPLARYMSAHQGFTSSLPVWAPMAFSFMVVLIMRLVQAAVAVCMIAAAIRPAGVQSRRFMALFTAMILTTVTNGSSGYALIFLFFLVFFEPWRGAPRIAILVSAYLLCLPIDWAFWPIIHGPAQSFLGGRDVRVSFGVSAGQFLRPGLLLVIQIGLIVLNLQDILTPVRERHGRIMTPKFGAGASTYL
jgi:hypothetical protein